MIRCKLIERSVVGSALGTADVGRAVSGEALTIGRAASCKVYLPDPSIRLDHASIQRAEDGFLYLQASGPVFIDQKLQASCKLEVGQSISIGPYAFHLEALRDGPQTAVADLTLLYSVDEAGGQAGQGASSNRPPSRKWEPRPGRRHCAFFPVAAPPAVELDEVT